MIKPQVRNEWGQLREIIVGSPIGAQVPTIGDKCLHSIDYAHLSDAEFEKIPTGNYPQQLIDETEEDLNNLADTLKDMGVIVHRPVDRDFSEKKGNDL